MVKQLRLARTPGDLVKPACTKQDQPGQVTYGCVQLGLEHLKGWRLCSLPGQPRHCLTTLTGGTKRGDVWRASGWPLLCFRWNKPSSRTRNRVVMKKRAKKKISKGQLYWYTPTAAVYRPGQQVACRIVVLFRKTQCFVD